MDKNIEKEVFIKKKKRTALTILFIIVILISSIGLVRYSFSSQLQKAEITTAIVERGDIENTINASGEVLPEFEEIISSPIEATIQNVLLDVGSKVKCGQSILALDKSVAQAEYEKLKFQVASKKNDILRLKLELDKSFYDIKSNNDIKQLSINSLKAFLENAKRLQKAGGGTQEEVEQAELNLKVAILQKHQLENEIHSKQKTMLVQMKEAEIATNIQVRSLAELERKLKLANVMATRKGILTWVNKNIGSNIIAGQALARIADLNSFKISGTISDNYLDQLFLGMPAIIRINEANSIRGKISNISPSVQNNIISFDLQLDNKTHKLFRPNLKVEIYLVTEIRNNILRVANGPAFKGAVRQDIFILKDNKAIRKTIEIGLSNFDYVEIKDQVSPGDIIITSDMSEYKNTREIIIKN